MIPLKKIGAICWISLIVLNWLVVMLLETHWIDMKAVAVICAFMLFLLVVGFFPILYFFLVPEVPEREHEH